MSVQSNITRIEGGKASLKTSINNKLNSTQQKITNEHIEDYHLFVDQISGGGGVGTLEIYENGIYDVSDYANVYVKITELVPCTSISFNKNTLEFEEEGITSDVLIATFTPLNTTDAIVWNSDNVTVASVTRISGTDTATVAYVGDGTCHITATCGDYTATCTVTCTSEIHCTSITLDQHTLTLDEPEQDIPCTAITLDKSTASVGAGETVTVTATLTPSDTTDTLSVISSDTTKATVTLSGNVATITGVADGSSNITFTCGDISEVCACTVSAGVPITSYEVSGDYTKFLASDTSSYGLDAFVKPSNNTDTPAISDISIDNNSIAECVDVRVSASGWWMYGIKNKGVVGTTTFTASHNGLNPSSITRTIDVVDSFSDGDLILNHSLGSLNPDYTNHKAKRMAQQSSRVLLYKVTPGNTYTLSITGIPKSAAGAEVIGTTVVHPINPGAYFPIVGDTYLSKDTDTTAHAFTDTFTIPSGVDYILITCAMEVTAVTLTQVIPYTKFDAIIEEVNMTLNDTISSTYWNASPSTASDVINATQTDSFVATIARNTDGTFNVTPSAVGTTTITYSPQTTPALAATSKINVVSEINDMCMLGAYRTHNWTRNSSTGAMSYQRVAKMKGYVFKVTPGDSYTVTYSKGDATHELHIYSGDTMVYASGATGGSVAQNSTELVIEHYPVTVVSHTVTIPDGQPYLFVSFIDSAEVTLTKN